MRIVDMVETRPLAEVALVFGSSTFSYHLVEAGHARYNTMSILLID